MNSFLIDNKIIIIFLLIILGWLIYLTFVFFQYTKDRRKILKEVKKRGVENVLEKLLSQTKKLDIDARELYKITDELSKISAKSIIHLGIVRYNPFSDTGGNQSFSIALLNSQKNGLVISSLHGRTSDRLFAKPIEKGTSKYHLSDEEKEAIEKALNFK